MITKDEILEYLISDNWFRPSKSPKKIKIRLKNGNELEVPKSYYHDSADGRIMLRVSEHGTYLDTWLKKYRQTRRNGNSKGASDPAASLQNLSVIFADSPIKYKTGTEPYYDKNGNEFYRYFVVEQYQYPLSKIDIKDFKKIISTLKSIENNGVFNDPLYKQTTKRANRTVLTPRDRNNDKQIPPTTNTVNPRQSAVVNNITKEVDKDGNVLESVKVRLTEQQLKTILIECIKNVLTMLK